MKLYLVKLWVQGPTKGSDAKVWLGEKVVVITGKHTDGSKIRMVPFIVFNEYLSRISHLVPLNKKVLHEFSSILYK